MGRLHSVQFLRFIAASLVVLVHYILAVKDYSAVYNTPLTVVNGFYDFSHLGLIGVDIFFIISGFIMGVIAVERFEDKSFKNVKKFLWRRFVRVVPLYWFYTFVKAGLLLFLPFLFVADAFDVVKLLKSLFFIPHMNLNGSTLPIHSVGWTLNFEVMFYALAAISLLLVKSWRFTFILLAFVTLVLMGTFVESASEAFAFWTRTIVFEFVLGLAVAWIYVRKKDVMENLPATVLVPLAIVCVALFTYVGMYGLEQKTMPRFIWFGIPSLCLFVLILGMEKRFESGVLRLFSNLGDSSYSLYLSHMFAIPLLMKIWVKLSLFNYISANMYLPVAFAVCVVGGHISYLILEKPLMKRMK